MVVRLAEGCEVEVKVTVVSTGEVRPPLPPAPSAGWRLDTPSPLTLSHARALALSR